jgi:diaminohydroxyphosphoribosylaminopyrimidine deaminase/5-amino-6-(5-phosphoribosylamino)uracil reductase
MLRSAGLAVEVGPERFAANDLNAGFFQRIKSGRPLVTLKVGASLDGRIATHSGESRWITGEEAREHAHLLRAEHDAIMVGIGTALADNPELNCRLPGLEHRTPTRVIADSWLRLPMTAKVIQTARKYPTVMLTRADTPASRRKAFLDCGVDLIDVPLDAAKSMNRKAYAD